MTLLPKACHHFQCPALLNLSTYPHPISPILQKCARTHLLPYRILIARRTCAPPKNCPSLISSYPLHQPCFVLTSWPRRSGAVHGITHQRLRRLRQQICFLIRLGRTRQKRSLEIVRVFTPTRPPTSWPRLGQIGKRPCVYHPFIREQSIGKWVICPHSSIYQFRQVTFHSSSRDSYQSCIYILTPVESHRVISLDDEHH